MVSWFADFVKQKSSLFNKELFWSWRRVLNTRPADYESAALPTELFQRIDFLSRLGIADLTGNRRPADYESAALPTELYQHILFSICWRQIIIPYFCVPVNLRFSFPFPLYQLYILTSFCQQDFISRLWFLLFSSLSAVLPLSSRFFTLSFCSFARYYPIFLRVFYRFCSPFC